MIYKSKWNKLPEWVSFANHWFVISDIHGRATELKELLAEQPQGSRLIILGDLADRGEESLAVFEILDGRTDAIILHGNHDLWLSEFLASGLKESDEVPATFAIWFKNGGLMTFLDIDMEHPQPVWQRVLDRMVPSLQDGNLLFVHAGVWPTDPKESLSLSPKQAVVWANEEILKKHYTWIREPFLSAERIELDGKRIFVVHGHSSIKSWNEMLYPARLCVDNGPNILSAVELRNGEFRAFSC